MSMTECEVLFRPGDEQLRFLPEGPIDLGEGRFSWVAIQHGGDFQVGSLNIFDLATGENTRYDLPGRPGFAFPKGGGRFIVGAEGCIGEFDTVSGAWSEIVSGIDADVDNTIVNDGVALDGGLIFGTKDLEFKTPKAGLYYLRDGGQPMRLRSDQICSNGKVVLEQDGPVRFLDIDSPTRLVVEYTLDGGTLSAPRVVLDLSDCKGVPDGMVTVPGNQSVIIAFYNPEDAPHGEARQFSLATGELENVWKTDLAPQVTCPLLLEHKGAMKLVLTTAVEHMSAEKLERHPNSGCLFIGDA